jgi:hypothetical protein
VFCREDKMVDGLDSWISTVFDPDHIEETHAALIAARAPLSDSAIEADLAREKMRTVTTGSNGCAQRSRPTKTSDSA